LRILGYGLLSKYVEGKLRGLILLGKLSLKRVIPEKMRGEKRSPQLGSSRENRKRGGHFEGGRKRSLFFIVREKIERGKGDIIGRIKSKVFLYEASL